ncbi:MAG TPA: glycoside hydrolase family 57 protein [Terriglobia bacterium]|nr:glycoside hydrolase family 57 protein [Terriglobia bacterium]
MPHTYLMLLWHMHQPFYKDLAEDRYVMPWVRLHALKDYFGMVQMLDEFPSVHMTFNLVPSLLLQLEDYAGGSTRERPYELAAQPTDELKADERESLLNYAFQINRNLVNRYPRFRELDDRVRAAGSRSAAAKLLSVRDLRDLQVLSQLAWFDEIYLAGDPEVRALTLKGQGYTEDDKVLVFRKEQDIFKATLESYRKAATRRQIELSTSPFYHPIMPLLADSGVASESHPGVRLPRHSFRHPEDVRAQLVESIALHERLFGERPCGVWPSEGSVSDEALGLAIAEGFTWAATDEGVLARTLQVGFDRQADGTLWGGNELYRPHRFLAPGASGEGIRLFFRDHQLSDLVGFVYSRMDPEAAAADLHQRIRAAGQSTGDAPALVSIILDGENCWEYYPGNGREFLRSFYRRIAADPDLTAVTASEALEAVPSGTLAHVVPGSWINANFDVWIGADEDNLAWDMLNEARDFFARAAADPALPPAQRKLAQQELWIAEGSDWCWWYGPEHSSELDDEFDYLYRKHLSNMYRMLDASPPDDLATPIKHSRGQPSNVAPTGRIEPKIDGRVTNYFEWMGAGVYTPDIRFGAMHGASLAERQYIEALYYGYSERAMCLRLDLSQLFLASHSNFEIRASVNGESPTRLYITVEAGKLSTLKLWKGRELLPVCLPEDNRLELAFERVFELRMDYELLGAAPERKLRLQVSLWADELPLQVIPQEGWLTLELTKDLLIW